MNKPFWKRDIFIDCPGDRSVGIEDTYINFQIDLIFDGEEHKEFVRNELKEAFSNIYDTQCIVHFDGEKIR